MKFVLFVEGQTEKKAIPSFIKRWIDPQLREPVGIQPIKFVGAAQYIKDIAQLARLHLNHPKGDIIAGIGLLDLHGLPFSETTTAHEEADQRCAVARAAIENSVGHSRFRQYFAVHEIEAWLLSNPELHPASVRKRLPGRHREPETVDFDEPPAKLLNRLFKESGLRGYDKVITGSTLFAKLDPRTAYSKCPHLREMLDEMLFLAREAGL